MRSVRSLLPVPPYPTAHKIPGIDFINSTSSVVADVSLVATYVNIFFDVSRLFGAADILSNREILPSLMHGIQSGLRSELARRASGLAVRAPPAPLDYNVAGGPLEVPLNTEE